MLRAATVRSFADAEMERTLDYELQVDMERFVLGVEMQSLCYQAMARPGTRQITLQVLK